MTTVNRPQEGLPFGVCGHEHSYKNGWRETSGRGELNFGRGPQFVQ